MSSHHPTYYTSRLHGSVQCSCGWKWGYGNGMATQLRFGEHLVDNHLDDDSDVRCPECEQGKHANCSGTAWSNVLDDEVACPCAEDGHS